MIVRTGIKDHSSSFFCSGDLAAAKILVIGHDRRLQLSHALADNAFFGDYYFRQIPIQRSEHAKYKLAEAVYGYVGYLTSYKYTADQVVLTNLCDAALPHAPRGRTVYIPEDKAWEGVCAIQDVLRYTKIGVILAMSAQVNYWLQKLGFYPPVGDFLGCAEPKSKGVASQPPYYEPKKGGAFKQICGMRYLTSDSLSVFPILHIKNWPLRGAFDKAYGKSYKECVNLLRGQVV